MPPAAAAVAARQICLPASASARLQHQPHPPPRPAPVLPQVNYARVAPRSSDTRVFNPSGAQHAGPAYDASLSSSNGSLQGALLRDNPAYSYQQHLQASSDRCR